MTKKIAATVLVTAALSLPVMATAPAAIADPLSTGSSSGSGETVNNLICSIRSYLGMGGCVYLP
ncbi:hypothetical protein AB0L97_00800 [Nocardia sp. NPDC051911]|uniref:hypothetical protein n=1 Tax=Nocardia sp. NPDC051911 TaxID=3154648 RepID=UPI0034379E4E